METEWGGVYLLWWGNCRVPDQRLRWSKFSSMWNIFWWRYGKPKSIQLSRAKVTARVKFPLLFVKLVLVHRFHPFWNFRIIIFTCYHTHIIVAEKNKNRRFKWNRLKPYSWMCLCLFSALSVWVVFNISNFIIRRSKKLIKIRIKMQWRKVLLMMPSYAQLSCKTFFIYFLKLEHSYIFTFVFQYWLYNVIDDKNSEIIAVDW